MNQKLGFNRLGIINIEFFQVKSIYKDNKEFNFGVN